MQLVVLGLNHKTVSVEVRERFAISVDNINKGLRHLDNYNGISEVVILSTCNRTEIYAVVDDANENMQDVKEFFFTLAGSDDVMELVRAKKYDEAEASIRDAISGFRA